MTGPTPAQFDTLLAALRETLDGASAGLRVAPEFRAIAAVVKEQDEQRDAIVVDGAALEDGIRLLEAQRDLLALAREEVAEHDRLVAKERSRREREDRAIVAAVRAFMAPYSLMAVGAVALGPAVGVPFGEWALIGAVPAIFGLLEMRRRTQLMDGRSWVILNDEVSEVVDRVRIYHAISVVAIVVAVGWFLAALLSGGGP